MNERKKERKTEVQKERKRQRERQINDCLHGNQYKKRLDIT
jgi:hypothetical protein